MYRLAIMNDSQYPSYLYFLFLSTALLPFPVACSIVWANKSEAI